MFCERMSTKINKVEIEISFLMEINKGKTPVVPLSYSKIEINNRAFHKLYALRTGFIH